MERGITRNAFATGAVLLKNPKFIRRAVERTALPLNPYNLLNRQATSTKLYIHWKLVLLFFHIEIGYLCI
jgi:hypothetical protein